MPRYKSRIEKALEAVTDNAASTPSQLLEATRKLEQIRKHRESRRVKPEPVTRRAPLAPVDPNLLCPDCNKLYDDCSCLIEMPACETCGDKRDCSACKGFRENNRRFAAMRSV